MAGMGEQARRYVTTTRRWVDIVPRYEEVYGRAWVSAARDRRRGRRDDGGAVKGRRTPLYEV